MFQKRPDLWMAVLAAARVVIPAYIGMIFFQFTLMLGVLCVLVLVRLGVALKIAGPLIIGLTCILTWLLLTALIKRWQRR